MLSRTAENLYWAARYFERAETTARLLEVGYRMSMMPSADGGYENEWSSILESAGVSALFFAHFEEANEENVANFLLFDDRNPSSIKNCIRNARENARMTRTALTSEVWETINHTYLRFQEVEAKQYTYTLQELCDWMKRRASTLHGVFYNTQLQNEGFHFFNLGFYVERTGNTARLLDVKYYILLPKNDDFGGGVDMYHWYTLLRSVSARRAFHWAYNGDYSAQTVAHFLILDMSCPRSLLHCVDKIDHHLGRLCQIHGSTTTAHAFAAEQLRELGTCRIDSIIADGLHEFLTEFIGKNEQMTDKIAESYLMGNF